MHAAVQLVYREGVHARPPRLPPIVGQVVTQRTRHGLLVAYLWPLDWVRNTRYTKPALAVLVHPSLGGLDDASFVLRGYEPNLRAGVRRWTVQKWLCDVLTPQEAMTRAQRREAASGTMDGCATGTEPPASSASAMRSASR